MCRRRYVVSDPGTSPITGRGTLAAVLVRDVLRAVVTDIRPLQASADFRRLWLGTTVSQLGQQMTTVAVALQVYKLTQSSF